MSHQMGRVMFTRLIQMQTQCQAGSEATQRSSCVRHGQIPPALGLQTFEGQGLRRTAGFILLKQTKMWPCEGRALHGKGGTSGLARENGSLPRAVQVSPFLCISATPESQTSSGALQESLCHEPRGHSQLTALQSTHLAEQGTGARCS